MGKFTKEELKDRVNARCSSFGYYAVERRLSDGYFTAEWVPYVARWLEENQPAPHHIPQPPKKQGAMQVAEDARKMAFAAILLAALALIVSLA